MQFISHRRSIAIVTVPRKADIPEIKKRIPTRNPHPDKENKYSIIHRKRRRSYSSSGSDSSSSDDESDENSSSSGPSRSNSSDSDSSDLEDFDDVLQSSDPPKTVQTKSLTSQNELGEQGNKEANKPSPTGQSFDNVSYCYTSNCIFFCR